MHLKDSNFYSNSTFHPAQVCAPTYQQIVDWFEEKYKIEIYCPNYYKNSNLIYSLDTFYHNFDYFNLDIYQTINKLDNYNYIFWSYIFSILKFLIINISNPTLFKIQQILYKSQLIVSRNMLCLKIIPSANNKLNCITSAIINILKSISNIDEKKYTFMNVDMNF